MKKFFASALATLMLASSLAFAPRPAQAQGPALISSILNKMERNRRELHSLRAALTMQKYNSQIRDYDMSYGEMQYVAGGSSATSNVRVEWTRPARELLMVSGGRYTLYRPRLNQALVGSTSSARGNAKVSGVLGFSLNATGAQLRNQFDIELAGEGQLYDGGPQVWMLRLTPKGGAGYKLAEVWVDQGTGMPVQTRVTEKNGDSTLVRLTNIERNPRIPSETFKADLPAGVKIVKG
jgi:outer membrane lipoprotein-sorting protein